MTWIDEINDHYYDLPWKSNALSCNPVQKKGYWKIASGIVWHQWNSSDVTKCSSDVTYCSSDVTLNSFVSTFSPFFTLCKSFIQRSAISNMLSHIRIKRTLKCWPYLTCHIWRALTNWTIANAVGNTGPPNKVILCFHQQDVPGGDASPTPKSVSVETNQETSEILIFATIDGCISKFVCNGWPVAINLAATSCAGIDSTGSHQPLPWSSPDYCGTTL